MIYALILKPDPRTPARRHWDQFQEQLEARRAKQDRAANSDGER